MKHPERLIPEEEIFKTGERSSYLRYDSLAKFLEGLKEGLNDQIKGDRKERRYQLASLGSEAANKIGEASEIVVRMWKISEPHMKEGKE